MKNLARKETCEAAFSTTGDKLYELDKKNQIQRANVRDGESLKYAKIEEQDWHICRVYEKSIIIIHCNTHFP